jgi:multicomponent Na+:H+ antiporter subunit E
VSRRSILRGLRALPLRFLVFSVLLWIVTEGHPGALPLAAGVVLAAAMTSLALLPPDVLRFRLVGLLGFAPWFIGEAVRGGLDVASRAFHPDLPLEPGFLEHRIELPSGPAPVFLANTISLLPGTLSVSLSGRLLRIHALDVGQPLQARLERLEKRVAGLFPAE